MSEEAYKRFVANEPESAIEYRTIEIYHPNFSQTYRFVKSFTNKTFTLESGAPRNAGAPIEFDAASMRIEEPAERNDGDQVLTVSIGNTGDTVTNIIDQISGTGFLTPIEVVYRKYLSTDTGEPAQPPLYLYASNFSFENKTIATFTAEDADLTKKRAGSIYTVTEFPGLA